jgi:hypothetical protein
MARPIFIIFCALLISACSGIELPQATPTIAPTRTPSPTPEETSIALVPSRTPIPTTTATNTLAPTNFPTETLQPTITLTYTSTNAPSATATPTLTPSQTFTATDTNAPTPTPTFTPSQTMTPQPTATFTASFTPPPDTATFTPIPTSTPLPTIGPTATRTFTLTPTFTLTNPPTATFTAIPPTRTPNPTRTIAPSATPNLTLTPDFNGSQTPVATFTPRITSTPTNTLPPATLNVTPTFITAIAETPLPQDLALTITPVTGTETVETFDNTPTTTVEPTIAAAPTVPFVDLGTIGDQSFTTRIYSIGAGTAFNVQTGVGSPSLLIPHPTDPNKFIMTDTSGQLFDLDVGSTRRACGKMFDIGPITDASMNNGYVSNAAWSRDGKIAFIVDAWQVRGLSASGDDGVWYYRPGECVTDANKLLSHCPQDGAGACNLLLPADQRGKPYNFRTNSVLWSPDNQRLLATIEMFDQGDQRRVLMVLTPGENSADPPDSLRYEYGDWARDGRLVVSGAGPDGRMVLGYLSPDGVGSPTVMEGLEVRDGVESSRGLVTLARTAGSQSGFAIYNERREQLTNYIGSSAPATVRWSPDRNQVFVQTQNGERFIASVNGGEPQNITAQSQDSQFVSWGRLSPVGSAPPVTAAPAVNADVPATPAPIGQPEVTTNTLQLNQRATVEALEGVLRVRDAPSIVGNEITQLANGTQVTVVGGPVIEEAGAVFEWWQIQTNDGITGWMAAKVNDRQTLFPLSTP